MSDWMLLWGAEEVCPRCWGRGFLPSIATTVREECWKCDGLGKVIATASTALSRIAPPARRV